MEKPQISPVKIVRENENPLDRLVSESSRVMNDTYIYFGAFLIVSATVVYLNFINKNNETIKTISVVLFYAYALYGYFKIKTNQNKLLDIATRLRKMERDLNK